MNTCTPKLKIQSHLQSLKKKAIFTCKSKKNVQDLFIGNYETLTKEIKVMPSDKYFSSTT